MRADVTRPCPVCGQPARADLDPIEAIRWALYELELVLSGHRPAPRRGEYHEKGSFHDLRADARTPEEER